MNEEFNPSDEVIRKLRARIADAPENLRLRFELGLALFIRRAFREAIPELQLAQQDAALRIDAMRLLADAFEAIGMHDLAAFRRQLDGAWSGSKWEVTRTTPSRKGHGKKTRDASNHQARSKPFVGGLLAGILLGAAAAWSIGWLAGFGRQPYGPIEEAKICYNLLTESAASLQPQTREYLKARLYANAAAYIRDGWLDGWHLDFGPVDDAALGGLDPIKDAESTRFIYEMALRMHPRSASKP